MATLYKIHPVNPEQRKLSKIAAVLEQGGLIIYPTDTLYAFGCLATNTKGVERICRIRGIDPKKARLSILCSDISQAAQFTKPIENEIFRLMKRCVPGPYTFILNGSNQLPKLLKDRKGTIGIRIPDNPIAQALLEYTGAVFMTASIQSNDEDSLDLADFESIVDRFDRHVDAIIEGETPRWIPSTVLDCTSYPPEIIREGLGVIDW